MMNKMVKMSSPWEIYAHKVSALFQEDSEVSVIFDDENKELKLLVDNPRKADAIAKLLPEEKTFGNVQIKVVVIPANKNETVTDILREAFRDNYAVAYIDEPETPFGTFKYMVFRPHVVQFFTDDIGDINGNTSTLYQEIAKDVLGDQIHDNNVFFCTDEMNMPDKFVNYNGKHVRCYRNH